MLINRTSKYMTDILENYETLCHPMDCSPPGSSVHGILQARILQWVAMPSFRGSSWPRDWTRVSCVSCIGGQILYHECRLGSPYLWARYTKIQIAIEERTCAMLIMTTLHDQIVGDFHFVLYNIYVFSKFFFIVCLIFITDNYFKNQDCMLNLIFPPLEMCLPFQKEHDTIHKLNFSLI